jgi:hypothetical protein
MSRRRHNAEPNADGFDSFLDIVANLVGILVILIMVLGVRAKNAIVTSQHGVDAEVAAASPDVPPAAPALTPTPPPTLTLPDLSKPARDAQALRDDTWQLDEERKKIHHETEVQRAFRNQVQLLVSLAEKELDAARGALTTTQQQSLEIQREKDQLSEELSKIRRTLATAEITEATPRVIEHHPTPLAKTVFGVEWHYRLLNGRLAYVPMDECVREVKNEVQHKVWKLKESAVVDEVVGPIQGFRMRYVLERTSRVMRTPQGMVERTGLEFVLFELLPMSADLGEPLEQALQGNSQFLERLKASPPNDTTITVWTYPDSFAEYHRLKEFLWSRGYSIAARPIPHGVQISGSPHGTSSVTQ